MTELPRFTRLLRAKTNLEIHRELRNKPEEHIQLQLQRKNERKKGVTWKELKTFIEQEQKGKHFGILTQLQSLWSQARDMLGNEENAEIIDETAIYLLRMFIDQKMVMLKHMSQLRQLFGTVTSQQVNKICQIVNEIAAQLSESCRAYLEQTEEEETKSRPAWGANIKCILPGTYAPDFSKLQDLTPNLPSNNANHVLNFSMMYPETKPNEEKKPKDNQYSRAWLAKHVNSHLVDAFLDLLKSSKSNDALQNELFDFLGFDKFEVMEEILKNRKTIVKRCENEVAPPVDKTEKLKERLIKSLEETQQQIVTGPAPAFLMPVVVQSDKQKQKLKQARKDEKKLKNLLAATAPTMDEDLSAEELNPLKLRYNLQQSLLRTAAQNTALPENKVIKTSGTNATSSAVKKKYPYVFDSNLEIKTHAGFLAGQKLMLPDNAQRIDNRTYEEVKIPAKDPPPLEVGNKRIQISSLDEIGQIAFKGTKELNRIQTIVYSTAYHTNENLLICAPTGAGKTNVAMLTIVHTIRAHADQGVILRDQFKIVYVAPMKALASEMTANFGKKLAPLGILVRELTGDMQLTKAEMQATQMLVTTPEKWDVVTRKGSGDVALISLVRLLIFDEVHLLHGARGPVIESLVARTLRLVESSQSMIRIVGLSATLPNYIDVSHFLRVNPMVGLFYFDSRFRPVPLNQNFIGVKSLKMLQQLSDMDTICFDKCLDMVRNGHQVMVFVHARNATARTATVMREMAQSRGQMKVFAPENSPELGAALKVMGRSRNKQLLDLFQSGFAMHHAGMLRADRNLVEKYFTEGLIRVLCCTATLAWGVNLPAHAVIIKGTEVYDSKQGAFVDIGILDVLQIFGRAGRPQFDTSGTGTIITTHDKLNLYLSLLTNQFPIESSFINCLADNLNAEITLGTISNIDEAIQWLSYTYLHVRMRINPLCYGLTYEEVQRDPTLERKRRELIHNSAMALDKAKMIRFNTRTGDLNVTDMGRTASHFYVKYDTVEIFNELMRPIMSESEIIAMMACASEFQQLKVRDDEMDELDELTREYCEVAVKGGSENIHGKVNILMQTYLSRGFVKSFSLMSDMTYITQNAVRIARALFTIALQNNNSLLAGRLLTMCKMFERQMWEYMTPLRQFPLQFDIIDKVENRGLSMAAMKEMESREISDLLRNQKFGGLVSRCAHEFPSLDLEASLQPITRTVLRIRIFVTATFRWNDRVHGKQSESFYIWVEDPENNFIYHSEMFQLTKKMAITRESQEIVMTIPLKEPMPPQYYIRATSDTWLGSMTCIPISFKRLILPEIHPPHTELLPLQPLAVEALDDRRFEALYNFTHFNAIQTQIFHCLYHTDGNVLLGAPTGSGKTIAAEIGMFRVFRNYPRAKVVYIAPLKALVRERMADWKHRIEEKLGKKVVELTGDVTPDARAIAEAQVIVTTPEKWDGISRSWQTRAYVRDVALIVIDEIHLLGEDRGPVLEVIVSRTNFIASHTSRALRIIGLSTALANARDLANWLGIGQMGLYNFKPSVRPVPLSVHISGYPGKHYCPRMATMNRPCYQAIRQYSPCTPALIFVASRRQTRLTALDLIAFLAGDDNPKQFMHTTEQEMDQILANIKDTNLKLTLAFGIGLHHAGLQERDRKTVEELFLHRKIQVLVATATLAWGVNLPAHLVIIKGTEFYDGKQKRYVDMPITDVLQMMGRAGRPQFGNEGVACVLVHDVKKNFYKKFLYDPFPVESNLLAVLPDHINAEIVAGTVQSKQGILDYLTWTYFFRRLMRNPTYYKLDSVAPHEVNHFLSTLVEQTLQTIEQAGLVEINNEERTIQATSMGCIASYYYLSHQSMRHFADTMQFTMTFEKIMRAMCDAFEFNEHPVRHNEDKYNAQLGEICRLKVDPLSYDSPHVKVFLLLQAHFSHLPLPNTDFATDTKSVLDQSIRILQAMIDVCAERGFLAVTLRIQLLMQCVVQARWADEPVVMCLPHVNETNCVVFENVKLDSPHLTLPALKEKCLKNYESLAKPLRAEFEEPQIEQIHKVLCDMPTIEVNLGVRGPFGKDLEAERAMPQPLSRDFWLDIYADQEYTLNVDLNRLGLRPSKSIHCPNFPKGKDEGWFLSLGLQETGELLALKRVMYRSNRSSHQLCFMAPANLGRIIYTIYLISDGYIGLDQQYNLQLNVVGPSPGFNRNVEENKEHFDIYDKSKV